MRIHGLQKMTLLDFPGHVACTVFLGGCDLRCPFCHNFELVDGAAQPLMDVEELFAFLEKRHGLLEGVAITGGEPCLRDDLPELLREIRRRGFHTKLDTNGTHPDRLARILEEGLADYVAMDIKNSPARYAVTAGVPELNLAPVRESVQLLLGSNISYEFRTTVVKEFHSPQDFEAIGQWIAGARAYYLQAFTDRDTVPYGNLHTPDPESMEEFRRIVQAYVPNTQIRGM